MFQLLMVNFLNNNHKINNSKTNTNVNVKDISNDTDVNNNKNCCYIL